MIDDVVAVEFLIMHKHVTVGAVELLMFRFPRRTTSFDHHADRSRWPLGCMWDTAWDEEGLTLPDGYMLQSIVIPMITTMSPLSWKKYSSEFVTWKSFLALGPPITITKKSSPS